MLNRLVQAEPATVLDPELMGQIAAIGIRKGREFAPDDRMKGILEEAIKVANATGRTLGFAPRDPTWFWYEGSYEGSPWRNPLFQGGYNFETPLPEITKDGAKPFPPTGYKQNDARTSFRNRTSELSGRGTGRMYRPLTVQRGGGRRRSHPLRTGRSFGRAY